LEKLTNYYYFARDPAFFTLSGLRLEFFIITMLLGSTAAGAFLKSFSRAAATQIVSLTAMMVTAYVACDPRVCYSTGVDGFEPLRLGAFLGSVAISGVTLGVAVRGDFQNSVEGIVLAEVSSFVAIAFYPVIFTFAGTKLLYPFHPWPLILLLVVISFSVSVTASSRLQRRSGALLPFVGIGFLFAISVGMATAYLSTIIFEILLMIIAVTAGVATGAASLTLRRNFAVENRSKALMLRAAALLLVLSMTLVVIPDAVSGVFPGVSSTSTATYSMGVATYVGGYMDAAPSHAQGAEVTISFAGTNASAIQGDNFLAAGIGIHSAGCCVDGIDYAYRSDLYLFRGGNMSMVASGWEVCDDNAACGGHSWKVLLHLEAKPFVASGLDGNLTVRMKWVGDEVVWSYSSGGAPFTDFTRYQVPRPENHNFNTGVLGGGTLSSQQQASYFFQFGVMSRFPIGHPGWTVSMYCPSVLVNGSWGCIKHARTVQGGQSYWKVLWRWGENYQNVLVGGNVARKAIFVYSPNGTSGSFRILW
jgi:hypothetical protein